MKQIKQLSEVRFECNNCFKKSEFRPEISSDNYSGIFPFNYDGGWLYLNSMNLKLKKKFIAMSDKHFCCESCFLAYLIKIMKKIREEPNGKYRTSN